MASLLAILLVAVTGFSLTDGGGTAAATPQRSANTERHMVIGSAVKPMPTTVTQASSCAPVGQSSGYVNPLARAKVISERIDQGVDYAGHGALVAIGAARVTFIGTGTTGWPGAFIEYRLLKGPDAGCFVYYAEGVNPVARLRRGDTLRAGQAIATIIPGWSTGIELGWGSGRSTGTLAKMRDHWTAEDDASDDASTAGRNFSALIADLGGPAGRLEHLGR